MGLFDAFSKKNKDKDTVQKEMELREEERKRELEKSISMLENAGKKRSERLQRDAQNLQNNMSVGVNMPSREQSSFAFNSAARIMQQG